MEEFSLVETCKEKIKEHDITDELLWYCDPNELVEKLSLEKFLYTKKIPERINEIKKKHKEDMEKLDEEKKKLTNAQKDKISAAFGRIRSGAKGAGIIQLDAEFYLDDTAGGDSGGGCG